MAIAKNKAVEGANNLIIWINDVIPQGTRLHISGQQELWLDVNGIGLHLFG